jgi:hypothetical protein
MCRMRTIERDMDTQASNGIPTLAMAPRSNVVAASQREWGHEHENEKNSEGVGHRDVVFLHHNLNPGLTRPLWFYLR